MSDANINSMNIKQLRNEVQLLRDELAVMQRKYEDILYNLDYSNFSSKYIKETEDKIAFEVGNSSLAVAVDKIQGEVFDENGKSVITQTATSIKASVTALENDIKTHYSTTEQTSAMIKAEVSALDGDYVTNSLFQQTANSISTRVSKVESGKFTNNNVESTLFTQTSNAFSFKGENIVFNSIIHLTKNNGTKVYSFGVDESQDSGAFVHLHNTTNTNYPLVLGDKGTGDVYLGSKTTENEVATRGWVKANPSATAVFG